MRLFKPVAAEPVDVVKTPDDAPHTPTHPLSDEGVLFEYITPRMIVNFTDATVDTYNAHRRELHVNGLTFSHVAETPDGHWTYRHDS